MVTPEGIKPDKMKVRAIVEMGNPTDKAGIRHLLGMIHFLTAHISNVSTITAPLQNLLKSDVLSPGVQSKQKPSPNSKKSFPLLLYWAILNQQLPAPYKLMQISMA